MSEDVSDAIMAMAELPVDDVAEEQPSEEVTETSEETKEEPNDEKPKGEEPEGDQPKSETEETKEDDTKGIDPQHSAMLKKAEDETRKRQDLQRQLDDANKRIEELSAKPPPDPVEDPEGFANYNKELAQTTAQNFDQKLHLAKVEMSRVTVMALKEDYEDMEAAFYAEAKENPALVRQFNEAPNPALFAYEQGQRITALNADPAALREQIRKEEREKLEAEFRADAEAKAKKDAEVDNAISPSLATEGNSGLETEESVGMDFIAESTGEDATKRR